MKKTIAKTIAVSLGLCLCLTFSNGFDHNLDYNYRCANAATDFTCGENLNWNIEGDTLQISGYGDMYDYDLNNPAPWSGRAFKKVIIESEVTSIGDMAFFQSGFEIIDLSETNIERIGKMAFANSKMYYIYLPNSINSIEEYAFANCANLESVFGIAQSKLEYIGIGAFKNCYILKGFTLPLGVTKIEKETFSNCTGLKKITFSNIKYIGESAFQGCSSLIYLDMPKSLEKIDKRCFANCSSLISIDFSGKLRSIPYKAFSNCRSLQHLYLPFAIVEISEKAFENCSTLDRVRFPNHLINIYDEAFCGCEKLDTVIITDSVSKIGLDAFKNTSVEIICSANNSYVDEYAKTNQIKCHHEDLAEYDVIELIYNPDRFTSFGDLNSDSFIDLTDLTIIALYLIGDQNITVSAELMGDIDFDDEITLADLAYLRQYLSHVSKDIIHVYYKDENYPEDDFEEILNNVIKDQLINQSHYIKADGTLARLGSNGEIAKLITSNITYEIINSEIDDEIAVVTAKFSYPDVNELYDKIYFETVIKSNEMLSEYLKGYLNNHDFNYVEKNVRLLMMKIDDEWYLTESDDFNDVLTGGVYSAYIKQKQEIAEKLKRGDIS